MGAFSVVSKYLYGVLDGAERVVVIEEVLGVFRCMAVCVECVFVLFEPYGEAPIGLAHIRFATYGAGEFVYAG
jgi:hypothetical protein